MSLGNKIRELREAKHWTQGQLALRAGVTQMEISHIETGRRKKVRAEILAKLAKGLEVSVDTLNEAAGSVQPREPVDAEIDDLIIYLHGKNPDARTIRRLKRIAETLFAEEEEGRLKGTQDFD